MLMLIDTREPPDDGDRSGSDSWLLEALEWFFPWPALIGWLCAVSLFLDGWLGVAAIYIAIGLASWRALRAFPPSGLPDNRQ